jgi:UDP-galactopyranose mutase
MFALAVRLAWQGPAAALAYRFGRRVDGDADGDRLLVMYSQVAWRGVWQRPQELAMGLAKRRRVLYVCPMQAHERLTRYPEAPRVERIDSRRRLTVFSPTIFSGEYRWSWVFRLNRLLVAAELRWALRGEGAVDLFANTPFAAPLLELLRVESTVYDAMDDFSAFDWAPAEAADMERRLLERARFVFTGTHSLLEKVRPTRPDARFVPCGVDFSAFYRDEDAEAEPEPEDLRGLKRPLIGYVGTLSERIDTSIIKELAAAFPEASIVLIGPTYRSLGAPPRAPNIHYLGLKPHDALPNYMWRFRVGLLPFRLTEAAMAVNPVKTLEYLAAGCIVISTAIPDVERFYSDTAMIASSTEDFVQKTRSALEDDHAERIRKGIDLARRSSWESMVERMERRMNEM